MEKFRLWAFLVFAFSAFSPAIVCSQSFVESVGSSTLLNKNGFDDNVWEARCFADYGSQSADGSSAGTFPLRNAYPCEFTVVFSKEDNFHSLSRDFECTVPGGTERECRLKIDAEANEIPMGYYPVSAKTKKYLTSEQIARDCRYSDIYNSVSYPEATVTQTWNTLSLFDYELDSQKISVIHRFICKE